jgi:signal transduction histidine kinase
MGTTPDIHEEYAIHDLPALAQIVRILKSSREVSESLELLLDTILEIIPAAQAGTFFLLEPESSLLIPQVGRGYIFQIYQELALEESESVAGRALSESKAICATGPGETAELMDNLRPANRAIFARAHGADDLPEQVLAAPVLANDKCGDERKLGVLVLERFEGGPGFSAQDFQLVCLVADLIALADHTASPQVRETTGAVDYPAEAAQFEILEALGHELSMPLTAIKGYATALLLEDVAWSPAKTKEFLQFIEEECDRMEILLSNCLHSTSGDLSQLTIDPQPVSLAQIASQVVVEMKTRTDDHQMIVDFPPAFPLVPVDPNWIRQVFRNLLDNAIKYSPEGGLVVVRGEIRPTDVLLSISDQGIGIAPEDIVPLFEKYRRAKIPANLDIPGTGLGLPITRLIIEAHGGHIWAQSKPGEGTTMRFTLPLTRAESRG